MNLQDECSLHEDSNRIREIFLREYSKYKKLEFDSTSIRHIPRWDGGYDNSGKRYTNKWLKIAEFLRSHNCDDFEGFIVANFSKFGVRYPEQLYKETALNAYRDFYGSKEEQIRHSFYYELQNFLGQKNFWQASGKTELEAILLTLSDETNSLSPLFRFLIAKTINATDILERFGVEAKRQLFASENLYRRFWPSLLASAGL